MRDADAAPLLLNWYDLHARAMPWRVSPTDRARGVVPDPYLIWLSEVMLQQTTVAAVKEYFLRFTALWPSVHDLAAAADADVMGQWAGLGYYARARNLLACARAVVRDHRGVFPRDQAALLALPGVGPYTAAAIGAIAFDAPAVVVDGNVERVMARVFAVLTPLPLAKGELTRLAARLTPDFRAGDYAQAVMDLGATICTPRNPACGICPLMDVCAARLAGIQASLPRKIAKPTKPTRSGSVWIVRDSSGAWLLERRPDRGLLGGMLGFVGDGWDGTGGAAPMAADWHTLGEVRHTFTHFHLILQVYFAEMSANPARGEYTPAASFRPEDLPTVMRKAYNLTLRGHQPR